MATVLTWAKGEERRRPAFSVRAGETFIDDGYFSVCLNTDPYTFLGRRPLHLAPGTSLSTPLSLVTFQSLGLGTLLPMLVRAMGQGTKPGRRNVPAVTGLMSATIKGYRPVPYQLDGDFVGEADQIELGWAADALSLVVPVATSGNS